jgi:hypothetical protein
VGCQNWFDLYPPIFHLISEGLGGVRIFFFSQDILQPRKIIFFTKKLKPVTFSFLSTLICKPIRGQLCNLTAELYCDWFINYQNVGMFNNKEAVFQGLNVRTIIVKSFNINTAKS